MKVTAQGFGNALIDDLDWQRGDVLCVFSPNDVDYAPCVYGTLYAGGVVAPANPGYSASELAHILKDAGAKAIITQHGLLRVASEAAKIANIPQTKIILIGADTGPGGPAKHFTNMLKSSNSKGSGRVKLDPDTDLSFLAYSSGTTGLPKGVMLSHRNIISDVLMVKHSVGHNYRSGEDRILGVLPFFHIYGE